MSSVFRAAGGSGLLLIALYATSVHFTGEGAGRRLFAENLRKPQSRQLDTVCDISGDYTVGDASVVGIQITQTGSSFETHYVGVDASFSGVVASDCTGHVNFGETEGDQAFSFDATTKVFTFSNYHGVYFTKVQGRATSSFQLLAANNYCGENYASMTHSDLEATTQEGAATECAQSTYDNNVVGTECFIVYESDTVMKCMPCGSCVQTDSGSWAVSIYQLDSPSTPMPTSEGDTPMPTSGTPMPTASDTPMPTSGTPMPTTSDTPMPTSGTPMPTMGTPMPTEGTPMPTFGTPMPTDGSETPMPTTMTPAPTWSSEIFEPVFANWGTGCQLNLNVDECQAYATQEGKDFITYELSTLPRGCSHQIPDSVIIFNTNAVWQQSHLDDLCYLDDSGWISTCVVQMLCRPEDWVVQASSCGTGASLDQSMCERISGSHNMWGIDGGFVAQSSDRLPYGCYVDYLAGVPTVGFNTNSQTGMVGLEWVYGVNWDSMSGTSALCAKTAMTTSPTPSPTVLETPSPTPAIITNYMFIKNAHGICLDAKRRRDRGGTVHMWSCEQEACKDSESASFCAQGVADGFCALASSASPMAAALSFQESCQRSCGVCLSAADQNRNQHWDFTYQEGQEFGTLKSHDGICLDASEAMNGGTVWMWPCQPNNKRQMWAFDDSTQQLRNHNGYCLDARQRLTTGGKVHMWKCMPGNKNQKWEHFIKGKPAHFYYSPQLDYSKNILDVGHWDGPHHAACDVAGYYIDKSNAAFHTAGLSVKLDAYDPTKMEVKYDSGEVYPGTIDRETCTGAVKFKGLGADSVVMNFHYADGVIHFENGQKFVKD